jgi:hypothetical protein
LSSGIAQPIRLGAREAAGAKKAAEKMSCSVILSEAKNLSSISA